MYDLLITAPQNNLNCLRSLVKGINKNPKVQEKAICLMGKYRVIINDCPIVVGVENPHKFGMCR
jgi:hypothetical protein